MGNFSDLYYAMPVLMTYMGHQNLEATNRYVRMTEEMYPNVLKKVDEAYIPGHRDCGMGGMPMRPTYFATHVI